MAGSYLSEIFGLLALVLVLLVGLPTAGHAQVEGQAPPDSAAVDSMRNAAMQGTGQQQAGPGQQPGQPGGGSEGQQQEGQVDFTARDSLVFNFENQRRAMLFGESKVTHTGGELTAGKISMNLNQHLVSATTQTPEDTLSQPVLTRDQERIRSNSISFNYQSERGRFKVARTQMQQGNIIGQTVKNTDPHTIFIEDGIYSTCTLDHPHYYIKADRMKVVDRDEVFFTSARLYILDIPYPLVFPFGYIPLKGIDQQQSGLLQPTYAFQQNDSRGLGLQNLGWFQYFNEHLVGQASVDIFTSGTFFLDASTSYALTDQFNGGVRIGYSRENSSLEPTDPDYSTNIQKQIRINHSHTISPYASMSANINLRTADYLKRNSYDPEDRAETSTSSSINYRYQHPENIYNFSISANQNQNFQNNVVNLSGPRMKFSLQRYSPFAGGGPGTENNFWDSFSISYDNEVRSEYKFAPERKDSAQVGWLEALLDPAKYRQATDNNRHFRYAMQHNLNFSLGNLWPGNFVQLNPGLNYQEFWYPTSIRKSFNADSNRVESRKVRGFSTAREFSTNLSMNTTVYGRWNPKIGNITAIRHTMRPSLSFSYSPDFTSDFWGYYREVATSDSTSTEYSIYENEVYTGPRGGEQRALNFSLRNIFEAKQVKRDSLGEKNEKTIRLIDNLSLNTSYNFTADSMKLSDLNTSFSTSISTPVVEDISIRANANFNFYQRVDDGGRIDKYWWQSGGGGRLIEPTSFSVNASTSFDLGGGGRGAAAGGGYQRSGGRSSMGPQQGGRQGRGQSQQNQGVNYPANYDPLDQSQFRGFHSRFNDRPVEPMNSPFSLSLNFRYSWNLNPNGEDRKSAELNATNIRFQLTPKWNFSTRIGYDFIAKELTPSRFSLSRQLHCWNLSFEMNPFGDFQYFFFRLSVDAGQLQGLFQKLPGLNNLERSSSPTGRGRGGFGRGGF